jgi:hypothetical protein
MKLFAKIFCVNLGVWILFFLFYSVVMTFTLLAALQHNIESFSDWIERFIVLPLVWGAAMALVTTLILIAGAKLLGEKSKVLPFLPLAVFGSFAAFMNYMTPGGTDGPVGMAVIFPLLVFALPVIASWLIARYIWSGDIST